MKIIFTIINLVLGGFLLLVNFQPYNLTGWNALGLALGIGTVVSAIAFAMGKRWGLWTIPLPSLMLAAYTLFAAANPATYSLVAGAAAMEGIVFFVIFLIQAIYVFRKTKQA